MVSTGARKLAQVRENSNFFRGALRKKGFEVLGDEDSPVMPIMLYNPGKIPAFSRECLKRNVCFSSSPLTSFSRLWLDVVMDQSDLNEDLDWKRILGLSFLGLSHEGVLTQALKLVEAL